MAITPQTSSRRILGFMPARGGSKRIPRKNIIDFFGQPMLTYTLAAAQQSELFNLIHVSTDDKTVKSVAANAGADTRFTRPADLSDDYTPILPVAKWVLNQLRYVGEHFDDVIILFPCSPFLEPHDLQGAYDAYRKHDGTKNLLTVCRVPAKLEYYFRKEASDILKPIHPGGSFIRSQELNDAYYETGTFTIFSADWLLNATSLEDDSRYIGYELPAWKSIDIDTPDDLENARALYAAFNRRLKRD